MKGLDPSCFYKSIRWERKRETVLRRDEYLCRECRRYNKRTPANTVHHIIPLLWCLMYKPAWALESWNLISLCEECHGRMHNRNNDTLTELGLQWVRRLGQRGWEWIEQYAGA